jgi:hypothetical protein
MRIALASLSVAAVFGTAALIAQVQPTNLRARLFGFHEVPSVSTPATGAFRVTANGNENELDYELEYSGLSAPVTQAHIHLGQPGVNGGIMIWLCGTTANPGPTGTPTCPQSGRISGTIRAASVVGPEAQGIAPGDFAEALRAMRLGFTYANVHSTQFPGGEIRGQIQDEDRP